jgi:hypothetical protein
MDKQRRIGHTMKHSAITEQVGKAMATTQNWKTTGPENIHNLWPKNFKVMHKHSSMVLSLFD